MLAPLRERTMSMAVPWVIAEYPTEALAEEAGMTFAELEQFIFDAVLLDWDAEGERMRRDRRRLRRRRRGAHRRRRAPT